LLPGSWVHAHDQSTCLRACVNIWNNSKYFTAENAWIAKKE
jgi:hypothetical protein